eukprot:13816078-Alexandrium_andersonii.AAC.1
MSGVLSGAMSGAPSDVVVGAADGPGSVHAVEGVTDRDVRRVADGLARRAQRLGQRDLKRTGSAERGGPA